MADRKLMKDLGLVPDQQPDQAGGGTAVNQGEMEALRAYAETQARATRAILPRGSWSEAEGRKHR